MKYFFKVYFAQLKLFQKWLISSIVGQEVSPRLQDKLREVLLQRSRYACWLAALIIPGTIITYNYFFYPNVVVSGALISVPCVLMSFILLFSLRTKFIKKHYNFPLAYMFGVIATVAGTANVQLTGGGQGNFFFSYFVIYFSAGIFYPSPLRWITLTWALPFLTYVGSEYMIGSHMLTAEMSLRIIL
ncbi:MAG: hypothetical protein KKE11_00635, partial [Gammaproteobacteria bacterium]|nr:hypothetical protein [Gammaproteobacteria bacterium]